MSNVRLYPAAAVDADPALAVHRTILEWARDFLVPTHEELGRTGPVCPYTNPSLKRGLFYVASLPDATDIGQIAVVLDEVRERYLTMGETLSEEDAELLTFLIVFPDFDHTDSSRLDALQRRLKDDFVDNGLMIGQFHPTCDEPGLWNQQFRPLRSPIPLLAMRRMLVFDLPFLIDDGRHFDAWLNRFAPQFPPRVRTQLTARLAAV